MGMFNGIYRDRKVLITGHTGFKGSWLALWLLQLGANVVGYALPPPTEPSHFALIHLPMDSIIGDIRDTDKLNQAFQTYRPECVFHLAAQPIVRLSYEDPVGTFSSNVMGTINVFEAARACGSVRAIVNITSDKCYENKEWLWGYRENDPMGGYDPYSSSKGCAELVTNCWQHTFFHPDRYGNAHHTLLASCRSGNVIGGGDWASDRILPDIIRAASRDQTATIRNPQAIRPWQHVLEPLSGYLLLGQKLLEGKKEFADAWNFGPPGEDAVTVEELASRVKRFWPEINYEFREDPKGLHETGTLRLDCSKARSGLLWKPVWDVGTAIEKTVSWYRAFYESQKIISSMDIESYIKEATDKKSVWADR
jgi:CDP-glucose 4,6-dehydratase